MTVPKVVVRMVVLVMKECSYRFVYNSTDFHYTRLDNYSNHLTDQIHPLFDPKYESIVQRFVSNLLVDCKKLNCAWFSMILGMFKELIM